MNPAYRLIDSHAHLDEITSLQEVIAEAKLAGVIAIIAVGSDYQSNNKVMGLARDYNGFVYPALGLHPWNLKGEDIEGTLEFIEGNIDKAVAIGEIGLDYHKKVRERAGKSLQMDLLSRLLKIAGTHRKPAIIHSRYAWRDAFAVVSQTQVENVVFHWYTGTSSVLRDIINQGYFISASPAVEYHEEHRRAVKQIPLERLLLETDSPVIYRRGTEFEYQSNPSHICKALRGVVELRGIDETQVAEMTTVNALRLFNLEATC